MTAASSLLRRALLAVGAAALCVPAMAELADIKSAGKLRVGIDFGAPFYGYVDDKMKPVGSEMCIRDRASSCRPHSRRTARRSRCPRAACRRT